MDIGHIMSSMPPIVENIFKHLSRRNLESCSKVCELWKRVAETEKNHREDIVCFFQGLRCSDHDTIHSSSQECSVANALVPRDIEEEMSTQLRDLKLRPSFCLTFATNYFVNEFEELFPSFQYPPPSQAKRAKQEDILRKRAYFIAAMQTAVGRHLPQQCKLTFCSSSGIIACNKEFVPLEMEDGYGISGIMIPHIPGLHIYGFPIDEKIDISKIIPENNHIKGLLIFVSPYNSSCYSKLIQSCLLRENSKMALGGAIVDRSESHCGSAVAFCGESVEAASIMIRPRDREAEVEKRLKRFEETGLLEERCFAFMFACVARGSSVYRDYNIESSIFHRLYPDIPLIGIFGHGEVGLDYLPHAPAENSVLRIGKLARCRKKYLHSFTTVFVMVSVKL